MKLTHFVSSFFAHFLTWLTRPFPTKMSLQCLPLWHNESLTVHWLETTLESSSFNPKAGQHPQDLLSGGRLKFIILFSWPVWTGRAGVWPPSPTHGTETDKSPQTKCQLFLRFQLALHLTRTHTDHGQTGDIRLTTSALAVD